MKEKHLFDELAELIKEINEKCPAVKEYKIEEHWKELLSEAEEVREAIKEEDWENLKEELGDVLWDWLTMCRLAEKRGLFTTREVLEQLREKIHRRNPHVFGNMKVETKEEAKTLWNEIKRKEKEEK